MFPVAATHPRRHGRRSAPLLLLSKLLQLLCAALEEGELRLFFCEASALRTVRFSSAKAELNKAYVGLLFFVGLHDT